MADTPPLLVVTQVGMAAASVATPTGPFVHITGFRIGSAYGYTPLDTDTNINGSLLYEGVPSAYRYVGNNTLDIILKIPPESGPYEFGEVTLDLAGPVMFAKAVFETPQLKYSNLGSNVISTYTFHALIKLAQSVAIFQIDTVLAEPPAILEVDLWSDVYPAASSANPEVPALLIKELDHLGNSTLIHQATGQKWTIGTNYVDFGTRTVVAGTTTSMDFAKSSFSGQDMSLSQNRQFVIEIGIAFRSVASVTDAGANWRFNLNPIPLDTAPAAGAVVRLHRSGPISFRGLQDVPLASVASIGVGSLGNGMNDNADGVISANGLLHNGINTGRLLLDTETLDYYSPGGAAFNGTYWPSGLYTTAGNTPPASYPPVGAVSGIVYNVATIYDDPSQGVVTQTWYPAAANSQNVPAYYRSLVDSGTHTWTPWRKLSMAPATGGGLTRVNVPNVQNYTIPADRIGYYTVIRYEPASGSDITSAQLVLNGSQICVVNVPPDNTCAMYTLPLNPGDNVQVTGDIGTPGVNTYAYIMLYPVGVTTWG